MNQPTIDQVDQAIRAVLAGRLSTGRLPASSRTQATFAGPLLSVRALDALGDLGPELAIAPDTVVTPLARDSLKKRGVTLRWISISERSALAPPGEWGFACDLQTPITEITRRRLLAGPEAWRELHDSIPQVAAWVASNPLRAAVVLTSQASLAVWIASRTQGVRAAAPTTADAVWRASEFLGSNLLAFEPAAHPPAELWSLLRLFRRSGPPKIPDSIAPFTQGNHTHEDRRGHWPGDPLSGPSQHSEPSTPDRPPHAARSPGRPLFQAWRGARRL